MEPECELAFEIENESECDRCQNVFESQSKIESQNES